MSYVLNYLIKAQQNKRLPHALLLLGNSAQKTQLALLLARSLACKIPNSEQNFGCGNCQRCDLINRGQSTHVHWAVSAENTSQTRLSINEVRFVCRENGLRTSDGGPQIFILPKTENITAAAANAFLKTLEEPSQDRYFILLAPNLLSVMPTLASRCQKVFCPADDFIAEELLAAVQIPVHEQQTPKTDAQKLHDIMMLDVPARVEELSKLPTTRDESLNLLDAFIEGTHSQLKNALEQGLKNQVDRLLIVTDAALKTYKDVKASANPSLAMENLFLSVPP